jgi:cob(I)alamin adenosyltransferase
MTIVINRVYTRQGDKGQTRLAGGQRVDKDSPRIEAYGTVDELNAVLGIAAETIARDGQLAALRAQIVRVQNELFDLGGELATLAADRHPKQALVSAADVERLEREMDAANEQLPELRSFILPGGGLVSAQLHQARTVCRRAERRLISLQREDPQREETIAYLNRLSDWLFVMGRRAAVESGQGEVLWRPGDRSGA